MKQGTLDQVINWVLVLGALVVSGFALNRQLWPKGEAVATAFPLSLSFVDEWGHAAEVGRSVTDRSAPVTLIEFLDLECPGCRAFNEPLRRIRTRYGAKLSIVFVHFPLPFHERAVPGALATECAAEVGRFGEMVSFLLDEPMILRNGDWESAARSAGVPDIAQFVRCMADSTGMDRISAGLAIGRELGVRATPTIIVNGWRFSSVPTERELRRAIDALLDGKVPPFPVN